MGEIRINDIIYGGAADARNLNYDNENSKLNGINVQDAIDEVVDFINGVMLTINPSDWIEQADGTWKNTVAVEGVTVDKMLDVSLYGDASEDEAHAFDFLITSIDVQNDVVVFTASEKIDIALNIILRGRMDLENKNVYVSDLSAGSIDYDNSVSGLDATNVQNAVDEIATMVNGLVVNVTAASWDLQADGTYKKIIPVEQITGKETLDVCLYPGDSYTNEQAIAFSELITSIETAEGRIILTATEEITESFRIFLYGKVSFDKSNLVALTDSIMEVIEITREDFEKLSEEQKASGVYHVIDDTEELSAKTLEYDDTETQLGANNVQDVIGKLNSKMESQNEELKGIINEVGKKISVFSVSTKVQMKSKSKSEFSFTWTNNPEESGISVISEIYAVSARSSQANGLNIPLNYYLDSDTDGVYVFKGSLYDLSGNSSYTTTVRVNIILVGTP